MRFVLCKLRPRSRPSFSFGSRAGEKDGPSGSFLDELGCLLVEPQRHAGERKRAKRREGECLKLTTGTHFWGGHEPIFRGRKAARKRSGQHEQVTVSRCASHTSKLRSVA